MNKKVLLCLAAIGLSVTVIAQQSFLDSIPIDENKMVRYEFVFDAKGTKDQLFAKTKIWIADAFNDSKSAIKTEDKAEGFIVGKGNMTCKYDYYSVKDKKINVTYNFWSRQVDFTMKIFLKDEKAKVIFSDMSLHYKDLIMKYDQIMIVVAKEELGSNKLEDVCSGMEYVDLYRSIQDKIGILIADLKNTLNKKAENDF